MYLAHQGNLLHLVRLWKAIEAGIVGGRWRRTVSIDFLELLYTELSSSFKNPCNSLVNIMISSLECTILK